MTPATARSTDQKSAVLIGAGVTWQRLLGVVVLVVASVVQ